MNTKKTVAYNVMWNWAGMAAQMLGGFLTAPFLVHHLGDSTYGLWIVIASVSSYFGVLDFGIGNSVGLNVAFFRARKDLAGVNGILSTAFFYLCGVGALALVATVATLFVFFLVIDVAPDQEDAARFALLLVGLNLALAMPLQTFDGILWAYQRFDLQNWVDIPTGLLRVGLTFYFIGAGHGLVALAVITLLLSLANLAAKAVLALRMEPGLRVGVPLINRQSAKGLFGYGLGYFLLSLIKTVAPQVIVTMIGSMLGTALVTPFTVATRLIGYANQFLIAGTGVLTPVATALHADADQQGQRTLLLAGGRACLALTLLFVCLFVFLGQALIRLWMGPAQDLAYPLLLIVMAGEVLPMSQHITYSIMLGKGRLGFLAGSSLLELIGSVALALLLVSEGYGLPGVCLAVAIPRTVCRGVWPLVHACRSVAMPLGTYLGRALLPAILVTVGPALLLGLVSAWWMPSNWPQLLVCGGLFSALFIGVAGVGLFGVEIGRDWAQRGTAAPTVGEMRPALAELVER